MEVTGLKELKKLMKADASRKFEFEEESEEIGDGNEDRGNGFAYNKGMTMTNGNATYNNTPYGASNRDNSDIANKYRDLSSDDSELEEDNGNYAPVPYDEDYDDIYDEKQVV